MLWVRVLIWVALAALAVGVVVVTLRGGPVPENDPVRGLVAPTPAVLERSG